MSEQPITYRTFAASVVSLVCLFICCAASANAQVQRTFVSAQRGDDANTVNNCSVGNPCRSFNSAISVVTAGGEVVALDSGGYGVFTASKAVSVTGPTGVYVAITAFSGNAITVNAGASDTVVLRGLTIKGLGATHGINYASGGALHVENCVISDFGNGSGIEASTAANGLLYVKDTFSRGNYHGIRVATASGTITASIDHVRLEKNYFGLAGASNSFVTIRDSVVAGAARNSSISYAGITTQATTGLTTTVIVENTMVTNCYYGIVADPLNYGGTGRIRVSNSTIAYNELGVGRFGAGSIVSFGNNRIIDNNNDGSFSSSTPTALR